MMDFGSLRVSFADIKDVYKQKSADLRKRRQALIGWWMSSKFPVNLEIQDL